MIYYKRPQWGYPDAWRPVPIVAIKEQYFPFERYIFLIDDKEFTEETEEFRTALSWELLKLK